MTAAIVGLGTLRCEQPPPEKRTPDVLPDSCGGNVCETCGGSEDLTCGPCPYDEEINSNSTPVLKCENCRRAALDEI
jgi:hypothetical protein